MDGSSDGPADGPADGPTDGSGNGSTDGAPDPAEGRQVRAGRPGRSGRHRRPTSLGPLRRGVREVGLALITAGVIILLFVGYQLWGTGIAEAHSQAALKRDFNTTVAGTTHGGSGTTDTPTVGGAAPPAASTATAAGAVDHLVIPKIHLDVFVVEGVSEDDLRRGPGHYPQTVFPGQNGNAAIAGHRTTYGAPFFSLDGLSVGDEISVTNTTGRTFIFKVSEPPRVVRPNDVAVLDPTPYRGAHLDHLQPAILGDLPADHRGSPGPGRDLAGEPRGAGGGGSRRRRHGRGSTILPVPRRWPRPTRSASGDRGAWPPTLAFGALVVGALDRRADPGQPDPALGTRRRPGGRDRRVPGAAVVHVREHGPAPSAEHLTPRPTGGG